MTITTYDVRREPLNLEREAHNAWCVLEYIKMRPLRLIAAEAEIKLPSSVCVIIRNFCNRWLDVDVSHSLIYGAKRRQHATIALQNYFMATGRYPQRRERRARVQKSSPTFSVWRNEWNSAAGEHAFLLRCEDVTFSKIARRLGISPAWAMELTLRAGVKISDAMRRTRWIVQ